MKYSDGLSNTRSPNLGGSAAQQPLSWLKIATQDLHQDLDNTELVKNIMQASVSATDYLKFLYAMRDVYGVIESPAFIANNSLPSLSAYQKRTPAILADLNHAQKTPLPPSRMTREAWRCNAPLAALGCRYVLDGSCHGATFVLPHLQRRCAGDYPFYYWQLLVDLKPSWPLTCQTVNQYGCDDAGRQQLIENARDTFKLFIHAMKLWS